MTEPIRWGICGTGAIAAEFVEALANVADAEASAVASNDQDRSDHFGESHAIARRYGSYEEMAGDGDLDVIYVASTQQRHMRDTLLFLEAGRHVLCEKPFALNTSQVETMIAAATANDRFLMEALWSRFLPSYLRLAELLAEGAIGEPTLLQSDFSIRVPLEEVAEHRLYDPHRGGGALLDLGIYPVQLAHYIMGAPSRVEATAMLTAQGLDEQTSMLLDHGDGRASVLTTAMNSLGVNTARVVGTEGSIHLDAFMHCTTRLRIDRGNDVEVLDFPAASLHFQVPEVHRCLREGRRESTVMPHSESLAIMNTLDQVRRQTGVRYPDE
jgi:predicted dehydrogenase